LETYRSHNVRSSEEVFNKGRAIIQAKGSMGSESWEFLEQLAFAALDIGQTSFAEQCIQQLDSKFPGSPRVDRLKGLRLEALGNYDDALTLYESLIESDPTNVPIWKRKISALRSVGRIQLATEELIKYLDAFYGDHEGWLELADIYASNAQYDPSLASLSHVLLLVPQNPFYVLQAGETAYTARDVPLALKFFLRVVEMAPTGGPSTRGWYGVKMCTRKLLSHPAFPSPSSTPPPPPKTLSLLDELATERVLASYSTS
ncbi:uncharacterized protein EI90DRAFT_2864016, partial [Cantharellus anzutake]|uniref:uncharacterized protein n=1 Tax=Cantharellus anzutake TaxID=1750568 RepID=UPI0019077F39